MKRALDTSSLPLNPLTGTTPHIDPASSFEHASSGTPKKARVTPSPSFAHALPLTPSSLPPVPLHYPQQPPVLTSPTQVYQPPPINLATASSLPQDLWIPAVGFYPAAMQTMQNMMQQQQQQQQQQQAMTSPITPGMAWGNPAVLMGGHDFSGSITPALSFMGGPLAPTNGFLPYGMNGLNGLGPLNGMNGMGPYGMPPPIPPNPVMSNSMNPNIMTGNYGPAAAAAAAAAASNKDGRTVYVGHLPHDASVDDLLNIVRFGPIEHVKILPEKSCVFISFLDGSTAAAFHADAAVKKLALKGQELRIGWGKASPVPAHVLHAVQTSQATRNVFVGNLPETLTEAELQEDLARFGQIDQVKIVRDKNIAFCHFLSIGTAVKAVQSMTREDKWKDKRVGYGKDRCAYVPRAQQAAVKAAQSQAMQAVKSQHAQALGASPFNPFSPQSATFSTGFPPTPSTAGFVTQGPPNSALFGDAAGLVPSGSFDPAQAGNRTIYIGGLHPDTTTEDLCNGVRGGQVERVKHLKEKSMAFVTFVDPAAAANFHQLATTTVFTISGRRVKIGWGKHSSPLAPATLQAVKGGASRNVYIGGIKDFDQYNEGRLREDFGEFGEIELINFFREKRAAFVNFTSIQSAQKAVEAIKLKPEYSMLRVSFGKDRCANAPRSAQNSHHNNNNNNTAANGQANGNGNGNAAPAANGSGAQQQASSAQQQDQPVDTPATGAAGQPARPPSQAQNQADSPSAVEDDVQMSEAQEADDQLAEGSSPVPTYGDEEVEY